VKRRNNQVRLKRNKGGSGEVVEILQIPPRYDDSHARWVGRRAAETGGRIESQARGNAWLQAMHEVQRTINNRLFVEELKDCPAGQI
jgi:hypothetical protein